MSSKISMLELFGQLFMISWFSLEEDEEGDKELEDAFKTEESNLGSKLYITWLGGFKDEEGKKPLEEGDIKQLEVSILASTLAPMLTSSKLDVVEASSQE